MIVKTYSCEIKKHLANPQLLISKLWNQTLFVYLKYI